MNEPASNPVSPELERIAETASIGLERLTKTFRNIDGSIPNVHSFKRIVLSALRQALALQVEKEKGEPQFDDRGCEIFDVPGCLSIERQKSLGSETPPPLGQQHEETNGNPL